MIGIETEYGIYVEGKGAQDLVAEATHLVKLYPPPVAVGWDYRQEHPRRDMRGFTVDHLSIDPQDAQFEQSGRPHSTDVEVRSDRVLPSGARLYNDHGHPEFSTAECTSIKELIAQDRAGERVMQVCAERRMAKMGGGLVALYKNNTDYHGASYGTHESYLTNRGVPFEELLHSVLPFLVTRQIFAGAGKVGIEQQAAVAGGGAEARGGVYQLSQRSDFFTTIASVDTLYNRPIVNTRDEPHTDPRKFRRFHVICGDANLCEVATFLKVGTTLLTLRLIETGWKPEGIALRDPVTAIKRISHDPNRMATGPGKWLVERLSGGVIGAVDLQRHYLLAAQQRLRGLSSETDEVLDEWEHVLNLLESDPGHLSDTLDWVAKQSLLEEFREAEGLTWDDPMLQSIDLEYHNVDPATGLYYGLEQEGRVRRIVSDESVAAAVSEPPAGSPRAIVRGIAVQKFAERMHAVTWSRFGLTDGAGQSTSVRLSRTDTLSPTLLRERLSAVTTPAEFVRTLDELERDVTDEDVEDVDEEENGGSTAA
ncbi:MAG: proteasome accessory factor PafA2 family protein [Capsulimonadales bacterium]|nr:proteasome accessory factor PafA2 family protein [Capsulimonadales bacterium]